MKHLRRTLALLALASAIGAVASDRVRERDYARAIEDTLVVGELVRLQAGGDEFIALYTVPEDATGRAAIVLHGLGVHPNWPDVVFPLRNALPEYGWATLALQMPVAAREAPFADYVALLPEVPTRIDAAVAFLREQGHDELVLIGHSFGATMAAYYLATAADAPIRGLVAIGLAAADVPPMSVPEYLQKIDVPVLDIYGGQDLDQVLGTAPVRAAAAEMAGNRRYRQLEVPQADHFFSSHDRALIDHVAHWLGTEDF